MKINLGDLKEIYRSSSAGLYSGREACPPPEALVHSVQAGLSKRKNRKIAHHIIRCVSCAREAKIIQDIAREEDRFIHNMRDCMDAHDDGKLNEKRLFRRRFSWNPLVALSLFVLSAAIISLILFIRPGRVDSRRGVAARVELISPVNTAVPVAQLKFVWKKIPNAEVYLVEVFDASLDLLWRSDSLFLNEAYPPGKLAEKLKPDETFYWLVTAVLPDGTKAKSPLREFRIRE